MSFEVRLSDNQLMLLKEAVSLLLAQINTFNPRLGDFDSPTYQEDFKDFLILKKQIYALTAAPPP